MSNRIYLYPIVIRLWHLINALLILVLIVSGISMQYSDPARPFLRFDLAVTMHNFSGIFLTLNYSLFVIGNIMTGNAKQYRIKINGLGDRLKKQFAFYTSGLFKKEDFPFPVSKKTKFNPIQQVTYFLVMFFLVPLVFVTGLSLLYSGSLVRQLLGGKALFFADLLHMFLGFCISIFLIIHLYFCTIGKNPLRNFKAIINGYHESH